jgi:hypothetical protein
VNLYIGETRPIRPVLAKGSDAWLTWPKELYYACGDRMKVNMLEAKNQLSRLVNDAIAGEEVVIAGTVNRWLSWCLLHEKVICVVGAN